MKSPAYLRPEIASVCRFLPRKRSGRAVKAQPRQPLSGVLAELAQLRGIY